MKEPLFDDYAAMIISEQEMSNSQPLLGISVPVPSEYYSILDASKSSEDFMWPPISPPVSFPGTVKRPEINDFAGPFGFQIILSSLHEGANFFYSELLKKLFTDMGKSVHLDVVLETGWTSPALLFIRALPVFLSESFEEIVKRCPEHEDCSDQLNMGFSAVKHVVRCSDPQAKYQTDPVSGRHSVIAPLASPQPGVNSVPFIYTFVCKSSCKGGIARRHLAVIFTLETSSGEIVGRRLLEVRVCRCPRRDKKKLEEHYLRVESRDQPPNVPLQTKVDIQQESPCLEDKLQERSQQTKVVMHQPRDVPEESSNTASVTSTNTSEQQLETIVLELPVTPTHRSEVLRQALAILYRDVGECQVPLAELDVSLLQIYREG